MRVDKTFIRQGQTWHTLGKSLQTQQESLTIVRGETRGREVYLDILKDFLRKSTTSFVYTISGIALEWGSYL